MFLVFIFISSGERFDFLRVFSEFSSCIFRVFFVYFQSFLRVFSEVDCRSSARKNLLIGGRGKRGNPVVAGHVGHPRAGHVGHRAGHAGHRAGHVGHRAVAVSVGRAAESQILGVVGLRKQAIAKRNQKLGHKTIRGG